MERTPFQGGDFQDAHASEQAQQKHQDQEDHLTDEQLIHHHITEALREDRPIDHATARCIAAQLHGGQASALYALASAGAMADGLRGELDSWRRDETSEELEPWLDALDEYLGNRDDDGPIGGWNQLWPVGPEHNEPESGDTERPPFSTPACPSGSTRFGPDSKMSKTVTAKT